MKNFLLILVIILGIISTVILVDFTTSKIKTFSLHTRYSITQNLICKYFKREAYTYIKATPKNCCWCNSEDFGAYKCLRIESIKNQPCG